MDPAYGRIHILSFSTKHRLASSFLRMQEYHSSVRFQEIVFSWEEFMDWYAARYGSFSYLSDWSGFSVPDTAFRPFLAGRFNPLTQKEQDLVKAVASLERPYYVIGTVKDSSAHLLAHQIIHALYYLHPEYRKKVKDLLSNNALPRMRKELRWMGYCEAVLEDKLNAHLVGGIAKQLPREGSWPLRLGLQCWFEECFGCRIWNPGDCNVFARKCRHISHDDLIRSG